MANDDDGGNEQGRVYPPDFFLDSFMRDREAKLTSGLYEEVQDEEGGEQGGYPAMVLRLKK